MTEEKILARLQNCPWQIHVAAETDSTNSVLKRTSGAPHGTVLLTQRQTGGRGRLGRQFASPEGGVYLSVLLHPKAPPEALLHLTAMVAVAARRAIMEACGVEVQIKWTNDLVCDGKKLGGILTEMLTAEGRLQSVIVGIGINCNTLPREVQDMATSLRALTGTEVDRESLAAALIAHLYTMDQVLLTEKAAWLLEYETACITVGKRVQVLRGEERRLALALGIDENGGLRVRYDSGETAVVTTGEVSVRGMYGYV